MIIPNLMTTNIARSLAFYRDILGMKLIMMVSANKQILTEGEEENAVFATLELSGHQLMLQTVASLSEELPEIDAEAKPVACGTIYFRDLDPRSIQKRVAKEQINKGPIKQWYGMMELYIRDPDDYIICIGTPEGSPPEEF